MTKPTRYPPETIEEYVKKGYWEPVTITDFWDRNAATHPHKEAVEDSRSKVTWGQAKEWTDRFALALVEMGIKKDEVLAIQLPNSVELTLMRVACEKAGVLCLPVLRNMRHQEMEYILKQTKAVGVVIPWKFADFDYWDMIKSIRPNTPSLKHIFVVGDEVPPGAISVKEITRKPLEKEHSLASLEERRFKVTEVSLINLTTGSTGFPKFVEYPICARLTGGRAFLESLRLAPDDVLAALAPAGGGPNMPVYYGAPQVPCKVVMLEKFSPEESFKLIERTRVTIPCVVPTQLALMVQHPSLGKYDLSSVRAWFSCGAPLAYSLGVEAEEKMGGIIIHAYGALDFGSTFLHSLDDSREVRFLTAGKPKVGTEFKIVDDDGREVKPGEAGELWGRGPSCSSGYFADPDSTWTVWTKDGWYKTGDLARIDENGNVVIAGRKKDMIIRGGQNIHPVEIENLLALHPRVQDVAIVAMPDLVMGEKACAFIVPKPWESITFEEMVAFLKEKKIAPYKLPERLEIVAKIPTVGDGQKIDKVALRRGIAEKLKAEGKI